MSATICSREDVVDVDFWTPDLQQDVLTLLAALALAIVSAVGKAALSYVRARIADVENQTMEALLNKLVDAAEQKFGAKTGEQKLEWVLDQLPKIGVKLDEATQTKAHAYLEAAVRARNAADEYWAGALCTDGDAE